MAPQKEEEEVVEGHASTSQLRREDVPTEGAIKIHMICTEYTMILGPRFTVQVYIYIVESYFGIYLATLRHRSPHRSARSSGLEPSSVSSPAARRFD